MKRNGFTLIELMVAIGLGCIVMLPVAMLIQSGYRSWNQTYATANCESQLDSIATTTSFGSIGRKSNKNDYYVYSVSGTTFTRVVTQVSDPEENLTGQAVEFRYWSTDLDDDMLTPTSVADKYALFYLDNSQPSNVQLKLDIGTSTGGPTGGAINTSKQRVTGTGVNTTTLAKHVTSVAFSHTTRDLAGDGKGCVRMNLIINDPNDKKSKTVIAATYIRNVWPQ
jgi:prepilin-type N-terminal cleavage/methylation domain-containing protein